MGLNASTSGRRSWLIAQLTSSPGKTGLLLVLTVGLLAAVARLALKDPTGVEAAPLLAVPEATAPAALVLKQPRARTRLPEARRDPARDPFVADLGLFDSVAQQEEAEVAAQSDPTPLLHLALTLTAADGEAVPAAVINGRRVSVGDTVDGAKVESIGAGVVVLSTPRRGRVVVRMD